MRVLLAEDDHMLADAVARALRQSAHSVEVARGGRDADDALASGEFDLVILDVNLPEMSGFEVLARLKSMAETRDIPILALTANTLVEDRYACFEAGMDGFLIKPLDREKLADALAGLAASRHLAA